MFDDPHALLGFPVDGLCPLCLLGKGLEILGTLNCADARNSHVERRGHGTPPLAMVSSVENWLSFFFKGCRTDSSS